MDCIEFKNASFRYPNDTLANEELNLRIEQGERVAIIGQNGAGKTTAVKMMNGLHKPTQGDVIVNGVNTKERTTAQISHMVGYVFQNPDDQIFNTTVRAELEFWPKYQKLPQEDMDARVARAVEMTGIRQYMDLNPYEIPYSTKKFVSIAAILAVQTPYLVLDEPTAGQDIHGVNCLVHIMDTLRSEGKGVIVITHDMEFVARNFERVIVMAHRHIIADGPVHEVFQNDEVLRAAAIQKPQIGQLAASLGHPDILFSEDLVKVLH